MDEEDHDENADAGNEDNSHACSLASGLLLMILGCLLFPFSFAFVNSPKQSTFPVMIVGGLSVFTTGICFLCMHLGRRKSRTRNVKTNTALNMMPVVTGAAPPSPRVTGQGVPIQQNVVIDMPTTQTLSHSIDSNSLLLNDVHGASNNNDVYLQNCAGTMQPVRHNNSPYLGRHVQNMDSEDIMDSVHYTNEDEPPPSYDYVMTQMQMHTPHT